jgi:arylsulfatase A-like enzyme
VAVAATAVATVTATATAAAPSRQPTADATLSARAVDLLATTSSPSNRRALLGWLSNLRHSSTDSGSPPNLAESLRDAAYSEDVDNPTQRPLDEDLAAAFFRRASALLSPGGRAAAGLSSARERGWVQKNAQPWGSSADRREDGERHNNGGKNSGSSGAPKNSSPNKAPTVTPNQPSVNYTYGTAGGRGDTTPPPLSPPEACVAPAYGRDLPPRLPLSPLTGRDEPVPLPSLPQGTKPNIILIFMDDLGFDDASFRHPKGSPGEGRVRTPNLERLARQSVEFDNFYVEPMCSQTRATLLTGRDYPKTGTLLINGGWDAISPTEKLLPEVMRAAGYSTTMAGKWHNSASQGYAPWDRGFEDAWYPTDHVHLDNNMRHDGEWVQTTGWMEPKLLDVLMTSLDRFLPSGGGGGGGGNGSVKNSASSSAQQAGEKAEPHVHSATGGPGGGPTRRLAQLVSVREEHAGNRADPAGRSRAGQQVAAKAAGVPLAQKKMQPASASAGQAKETFGLIHSALGGGKNAANAKNGAVGTSNNKPPGSTSPTPPSPPVAFGVNTTADSRPFFVYYAPFSIHQGVVKQGQGPRWQRPAPPEFLARQPEFDADPRVSRDTRQVWAMLEAYDVQIGRLLDYLDATGLSKNTYVLLTSDNGAALFQDEAQPNYKPVRMPSKMAGFKEDALEGGIRQALYVRGPGIVPGRVDSRPLLHIKDVVPTLAELGTGRAEPPPSLGGLRAPWDGRSFANLLKMSGDGSSSSNNENAASTPAPPEPTDFQMTRAQVVMEPRCVGFDFVPLLDPATRRVAKPQPLLDFSAGGAGGLGWERCLAVRQGDYKLARGRLYKFLNGSHVEASCNAVREGSAEEKEVKARLSTAARQWFDAVVADPQSFEKSPAFIGWKGRRESNVLTNAAVERPQGRVVVQSAGVSGFEQRGDAIAVRVVVERPGDYEVRAYYQSKAAARMTLTVGPYAATIAPESPSWGRLTSTWPERAGGRGESAVGSVHLDATPPGQTWEMRLALDSPIPGGGPAFVSLDNVKFVLQGAVGADSPFEPTRDVEGAGDNARG